MPTPQQLKSLAEEYSVHLKTVKRFEKEAEEILQDKYDKDSSAFHAISYTIIENKLKKHKKSSLLSKVSSFFNLVEDDYV